MSSSSPITPATGYSLPFATPHDEPDVVERREDDAHSRYAAGGDMNTGMGMLKGTPGAPMGEDYGPAWVADWVASGTLPIRHPPMAALTEKGDGCEAGYAARHGEHADGQMGQDDIAKNANEVPNFPQDAYMEGPMMTMDEAVERPENYA